MNRLVRILHVVGGMNRGGVETWLMHILRHIDRKRFHMDFLVHTEQPCAYDDEIRALGSRIIPCLTPSKPLAYARQLKQILADHGPYDVIHSHVHHYSGWVLRVAHQAGVPVRIAHSHNDTLHIESKASLPRRVYLRMTEHWIRQYGTHGLAASGQAAAALFGPRWKEDSRLRLFFYAIDLKPFNEPVDRQTVRAELGISADAFVIGHVGRFVEQKNHRFLIDIIGEAVQRRPHTVALLVGDGPLRSVIEHKVSEMGLADRVIFAGLRSDVPRLMLGAMDVFLFPSLFEGLGLVLIEAQAAGLPSVFSDVVPSEVDVVRPLLHRLPLQVPASVWANATLASVSKREEIRQVEALEMIKMSPFSIDKSVRSLEAIYS